MARPKLDDPELPLDALMAEWPQTISVFLEHRMQCLGCSISPFHTVADACREYRLDREIFVSELLSVADLA